MLPPITPPDDLRENKHGVTQSPAPLASNQNPSQPANNCSSSTGGLGEKLLQCLSFPEVDLPPSSDSNLTLGNLGEATEDTRSRDPEIHAVDVQALTPPSPPLPSHASTGENMASTGLSGGVMDCVISLDAYLADHQSAAPSPPSASKSAQAAPLAPRAVGARSSKYIVLLHEKYQALGIPRPEFSFTGDSQIGWRGKVIFSGLFRGEEEGSGALVLEEKAFFGTKQEAKEKLSERTFEELERLEKEGKVRKRPKTKTAKEVVEVQRAAKREKGPGVNYVGLLLEFQRSTNGPQPTYMDYTLGNQHSCEAIMDGYPDPYGSKETYFSSKKEARQAAARCVVEHFKANRQWPDSYSEMGGIKKKQKVVQTHSPSRVGSLSNANADATTRPGSPSGGSYAQQVASLATQLGLNTPTWNITSAEKAPGFHSVTCSFTDGGALEGPFGEVQHIFGKKKAKEECARLTLEVLRKERERRMEYGRKMMEGIGSEIDGEEGFESAVEAQNPR